MTNIFKSNSSNSSIITFIYTSDISVSINKSHSNILNYLADAPSDQAQSLYLTYTWQATHRSKLYAPNAISFGRGDQAAVRKGHADGCSKSGRKAATAPVRRRSLRQSGWPLGRFRLAQGRSHFHQYLHRHLAGLLRLFRVVSVDFVVGPTGLNSAKGALDLRREAMPIDEPDVPRARQALAARTD